MFFKKLMQRDSAFKALFHLKMFWSINIPFIGYMVFFISQELYALVDVTWLCWNISNFILIFYHDRRQKKLLKILQEENQRLIKDSFEEYTKRIT